MKRMLFFLALSVLLANIANAEQFFLKQTMYEGESKSYDVGGYVYTITLVGVFDAQLKAQFEVNGETTKALMEDESDKLSDGAVIQVRDVLPQESGDGRDMVQFNFFPASHAAGGQPAVTASEPTRPLADLQTTAAPAVEQKKAAVAEPAPQTADTPSPVTQKSTVDITKKAHPKSAWERFLDWFKGLFR
jgi:hypothetical protein